MADGYPDLFAAVGVNSGLVCGAAPGLPSALTAMKRGAAPGRKRRKVSQFAPLITFHGDREGTVCKTNARELAAAAMAAAGDPLQVELEAGKAGGRNYTRALSRATAGRVLISAVARHVCR